MEPNVPREVIIIAILETIGTLFEETAILKTIAELMNIGMAFLADVISDTFMFKANAVNAKPEQFSMAIDALLAQTQKIAKILIHSGTEMPVFAYRDIGNSQMENV